MKNILFVCTGNTCRSPMAEALFNMKADGRFVAKSAGVFAAPGSNASPQALEVLADQGIAFNHSSQKLESDLIEWADLILTMTGSHKQMLFMHNPEASEKVYTLKEYTADGGDISDPFGGSVDIYRETMDELDQLIDQLVKRLSNM